MTFRKHLKIKVLRFTASFATGLVVSAFFTPSFSNEIPEIVVVGRKLAPSISEAAYATTDLSRRDLELAPGARLDDVLKTVPGFGLFRRQSSRAAHPTTQGVSLRGLGPSGAGRTLVLLDGVPQNDAFGGWIDWSRLPTAGVGSASITRGAGAGPWGNAALAGVIRLQSRDGDDRSFLSDVSAGPHDTFDATARAQSVVGRAAWHGLIHGHRTDGSYLVGVDQRGPVDVRAADRGGVAELGARVAVTDDLIVRSTARYSESKFVNGLLIAESKTRVADGALSILRTGTDTSWELNVYGRDQGFRAVFAAVNGTRTVATPSLDQFAVPAKSWGGNILLRHKLDSAWSIDAGADVRTANGTTNENFQNTGSGFTRQRVAGGRQSIAGVFADVNWQPSNKVLATLGARWDSWEQNDGFRRESVLATGALVRSDVVPNRDGDVTTARAAIRYDLTAETALRAALYRGFRLPTLNELYRPFRVGNDITESNPNLNAERLEGFDIGYDVKLKDQLELSGTFFYSVLQDAVTNVTIRTTPGLDPTLGVVVPVGGVLRQRQNLSRIAASGIELDAAWVLAPEWRLAARYLYTKPKIKRSPQQLSLEGLRVAQVARHQGSAEVIWTPTEKYSVAATGRISSNQFDDDQNTRSLDGFLVADLTAEVVLTPTMRLSLTVENAFGRTIESGRSADGLVTVGTPRTLRIGLRTAF